MPRAGALIIRFSWAYPLHQGQGGTRATAVPLTWWLPSALHCLAPRSSSPPSGSHVRLIHSHIVSSFLRKALSSCFHLIILSPDSCHFRATKAHPPTPGGWALSFRACASSFLTQLEPKRSGLGLGTGCGEWQLSVGVWKGCGWQDSPRPSLDLRFLPYKNIKRRLGALDLTGALAESGCCSAGASSEPWLTRAESPSCPPPPLLPAQVPGAKGW